MNPWMQVTGWTLVHFVWQGSLLALVTAAGLRLCRRGSSAARYAIASAGLTVMLASPLITAALFYSSGSLLPPAVTVQPVAPESSAATTAPRVGMDDVSSSIKGAGAVIRVRVDTLLPFVVWSWLVGVMLLLVRFAGGCWRVHRLRVGSLLEPLSRWQAVSERLAARLRLGGVFRVVESGLVDAPTVIGWIRPVVLLPIAAMTNLSPVQIEAILAHELAHIRRRDYAVNLLQTVAETFLFYHPGVWWVSARVREEREHCCDDVAVEVCGEPRAYAAALAELASWRTRETALGVAATDGSLLVRVRRLLQVEDNHEEPRFASGFVIVALAMSMVGGVVVLSSSPIARDATVLATEPGPVVPLQRLESPEQSEPGAILRPQPPPRSPASAQARPVVASQSPPPEWHILLTDHFEIYYQPDQDLHAARVQREAERAYEQVSANLKHNLAARVDVILFRTTSELEQSVQSGKLPEPHVASSAEPSRMLLTMDRPADQWYGLITHEISHIFLFDIVPSRATPRWIHEGLAEYQRGAWDPGDLVALREAVRANAIPRMSGLDSDDSGRDPRFVEALGHAAFDFMESRWGKPGVLQFIFWLRQAASNGGDPYERALQVTPDEFDRAFEQYLRERVAGFVGRSPVGVSDDRATLRVEGDITAMNFSVPIGLACMELWVRTDGGAQQRWAVECDIQSEQDVIGHLSPGDRVIVTGPPARPRATQRMVMQSLVRPSDGFTWRVHSE